MPKRAKMRAKLLRIAARTALHTLSHPSGVNQGPLRGHDEPIAPTGATDRSAPIPDLRKAAAEPGSSTPETVVRPNAVGCQKIIAPFLVR